MSDSQQEQHDAWAEDINAALEDQRKIRKAQAKEDFERIYGKGEEPNE